MKNCEYYEELIGAAIDGEITAEEDKELRAHLESCGTCRSFYEAMQAIAGTDNALGEPPEDFTANVMALVHKAAAPQEKAPAKKKTNITRLVTRYGALAAVAAAAIWAGTAFFGAKGSSGAAPETAMFSMPAPERSCDYALTLAAPDGTESEYRLWIEEERVIWQEANGGAAHLSPATPEALSEILNNASK